MKFARVTNKEVTAVVKTAVAAGAELTRSGGHYVLIVCGKRVPLPSSRMRNGERFAKRLRSDIRKAGLTI